MLKFNRTSINIFPLTIFLLLICFSMFLNLSAYSQTSPRLIINGETVNYTPGPVIENGRTLVPIRIISEKLGAIVTWDEGNRSVLVEQGSNSVVLKIDSLIFEVGKGSNNLDTADVPAKIIADRTFVPLRLISNVLGVGIDWDNSSKTVTVDSSKKVDYSTYSDLNVIVSSSNNTVKGKTNLSLTLNKEVPKSASEVRYYLLDATTRRGEIIARGNNIMGTYTWLPEPEKQGNKIIFAALYDAKGDFLTGASTYVNVALVPEITINIPTEGAKITQSPVNFQVSLNFAPKYIKYELTYVDRDKKITTAEADPYGPYNWAFMTEDNGIISLKAIAFDKNGASYESPSVRIETALETRLLLGGVKNGNTIQKPVTLSANRNFQVSETQYIMRDPLTQKETILFTSGYGSFKWFPNPEDSGTKELYVRVKDTRSVSHTSEPISVNVLGTPQIILEGIGPNQVLTGNQKLKVNNTLGITDLNVYLEKIGSKNKKLIAANVISGEEFSWLPSSEDAGDRVVYVEGLYQGKKIISEKISFRIYLGKIYPAKPITEKDNFQSFSSGLALNSAYKTGMSAALQTSQAILETGWGQSVPVDKYTGKFSYNLFGIKGKGPAGSVTSNTWEEYNGVAFRTDADFRAYSDVNQSWDDHKNLLLQAQRYGIFRDVMHNSTQGAWALRRAGYATDSKYPLKLIDIIDTYKLYKLDEVSF